MEKNNVVEYLRKLSVESCYRLEGFKNSWSIWKKNIIDILPDDFEEKNLFDLGDNLSEIFKSTAKGRNQSSVSGGGYAWEGLVNWYLNLNLLGSRGVAFRKVSQVPSPIRESFKVKYGNFASNTEADIVIVIFPDRPEFTKDKKKIKVRNDNGKKMPVFKSGKFIHKSIMDRLAHLYINEFEIGIIQCKTNWKDNAQIPMLWNMIYSVEQFKKGTNIKIGNNFYSIDQLKFSYAFVTVPTNKLSELNHNTMAVQRVRNLSGGNYWGHVSKNGVASSIKEIFNNNYKNAFYPNQMETLKDAIELIKNKEITYFDIP